MKEALNRRLFRKAFLVVVLAGIAAPALSDGLEPVQRDVLELSQAMYRGDLDTILRFSHPKAIEMLAIAGGDETSEYYVDIYRNSEHDRIREAAITAMQISGRDDGLMLLYRESDNADEKRELLQRLITTGNEEVWDLIDEALETKE